ncbi:MAG: hypothetical protein RLZZ308_409 [Candidatus Parcubacteria bacterium]|jgi:FAD/FMN-containing dehydrogenase
MITASDLFSKVPPLFTPLAKILAGEVDCSASTLLSHSFDTSPYRVQPQAVIFPKNVTDIKHVIAFAREHSMSITVRGGGFGTQGGSIGEGIILDMHRYFNKIRHVNMMEHTVTVDAGTSVAELLHKLHSWGFDIPCLDYDEQSTVGALLATRSISSSSFHHGNIREWVEGMTIVVDTGEEHKLFDGITPSGRLLGIYQSVFPILMKHAPELRAGKPKLHEDSSGYSLWNTSIGPRQLIDQIAGSEGTLGIITSITFRIAPYKQHSATTCVPITSKEYLEEVLTLAKNHNAEKLFFYDDVIMQLSERYQPNSIPYFEEMPYTLLVTHTHTNKEKLHHAVASFKNALPCEENTIKTEYNQSYIPIASNHTFLYSLFERYTNTTLYPSSVANGLVIPQNTISQFLTEAEEYLGTTGKLYSISGNIGSGHIAITTMFDLTTKHYEKELADYIHTIFSLVKKYKGGFSGYDGEGLAKSPHIHYLYKEGTLSLFKAIKQAWDPKNIFNPGKKMGLQSHYLRERIR